MDDRVGSQLLPAAIDASGLSARRFSRVLAVNERTVRRLLAGDSPLTGPVTQLCRAVIRDPSLAAFLLESEDASPPTGIGDPGHATGSTD